MLFENRSKNDCSISNDFRAVWISRRLNLTLSRPNYDFGGEIFLVFMPENEINFLMSQGELKQIGMALKMQNWILWDSVWISWASIENFQRQGFGFCFMGFLLSEGFSFSTRYLILMDTLAETYDLLNENWSCMFQLKT